MEKCPKCLGMGEIFIHSKLKKCNLCDGEEEINNELAEDYISSLNPTDYD